MRKAIDQITIRSWPKVIFLYPVMFVAFICGLIETFADPANHDLRQVVGMIFFIVLCLNLLVISFEFSRFKTMSIAFFIFGVFFFFLYLSKDYPVTEWIAQAFGNLEIELSRAFYFCLSAYFVLIFIGVYITSRFNFWIIKSNEILHKEGFLGDVRRFPSPNLRMSKEISDVFEFVLMGSGRIVLSPASEKQSIILEHVMRVNTVERKIQELLSSLSVEIHTDEDEEVPSIGG